MTRLVEANPPRPAPLAILVAFLVVFQLFYFGCSPRLSGPFLAMN